MKVKTLMNLLEDFGEDREVKVYVSAIGGHLEITGVVRGEDDLLEIRTEAEKELESMQRHRS